ncbi:hypothetical protein SK128_024930, partial [Halocaridina rubra]
YLNRLDKIIMTENLPPGLEYLAEIDRVLLQRETSICICKGCEWNNSYVLQNYMEEEFMRAVEKTNYCTRQLICGMRNFEMSLLDNQGQEVMHISRPLKCQFCLCTGSCLQSLEVCCPPGTPIGSIHQEWSICTPFAGRLVIQNPSGDAVLKIQGPKFPWLCGEDAVFQIFTVEDGVQTGTIKRQWDGCCDTFLAEIDHFSVNFPITMDIKTKALLIGAMFLI